MKLAHQSRIKLIAYHRAKLVELLGYDERILLAKAASDGPCFYNPIEAMAAKTLRDTILKDECGLLPNGDRI